MLKAPRFLTEMANELIRHLVFFEVNDNDVDSFRQASKYYIREYQIGISPIDETIQGIMNSYALAKD